MKAFYVYRNRSGNVHIHVASCSCCNNGMGVHRKDGKDWYGPFETVAKAEETGKGLVKRGKAVVPCQHCVRSW